MRLVTALGKALHAGRPTTIIEVIREFPDIAEAAKYLSGAADKKSKPYLAQRRNLERYKKGTRKPRPATLKKLRRKVERRRVNLRSRGAHVTITAMVTVSRDRRRRTIGGPRVGLSGASMDELWDAWETGDREAAAELFQDSFGAENMGGQVPEFTDVSFLTITERGFT